MSILLCQHIADRKRMKGQTQHFGCCYLSGVSFNLRATTVEHVEREKPRRNLTIFSEC